MKIPALDLLSLLPHQLRKLGDETSPPDLLVLVAALGHGSGCWTHYGILKYVLAQVAILSRL